MFSSSLLGILVNALRRVAMLIERHNLIFPISAKIRCRTTTSASIRYVAAAKHR